MNKDMQLFMKVPRVDNGLRPQTRSNSVASRENMRHVSNQVATQKPFTAAQGVGRTESLPTIMPNQYNSPLQRNAHSVQKERADFTLTKCPNGDRLYQPSPDMNYFATYEPKRRNQKSLLTTEKKAHMRPGYMEGQPYRGSIDDPSLKAPEMLDYGRRAASQMAMRPPETKALVAKRREKIKNMSQEELYPP